MASFTQPSYVDQGVQKFGSGIFCSHYRVLQASMHSDLFFKGSVKRVPNSEKDSTLVRTSDGVDLVWFTKRGMFSPFGAVSETFYTISKDAVEELLKSFPPPAKLKADTRHRKHVERQKSSWNARGFQYGVYHFAYWYMKCHQNGNWPPLISANARPKAPEAMRVLVNYISETTWEHRLVSGWFKALDPDKWEEYHSCYQKLRQEGKLHHLDLGANDWGCFLGHALLINTYVDPHKDSGDVKRGWVVTYPWMDFEGGDAVYLDLGLRFKQRAGDFIMSRSCVLSHMTMPITAGQRWGNTWFTKANILETPIPALLCDEPECSSSYTSRSGLQWHKKKFHSKDASVAKGAGDDVVDDGMECPEPEETEGEAEGDEEVDRDPEMD